MAGFPWRCADCSYVPMGWTLRPRPCPRCGGQYFINGEQLVHVKVTPAVAPMGPLAASFAAGLTAADQRYLRSVRIGWLNPRDAEAKRA